MEWKTSGRDAREEKVPKLRASLSCRVESSYDIVQSSAEVQYMLPMITLKAVSVALFLMTGG